jgi:hypothetical protein
MAYYEATDEEARDAVAVVSGLRQSGAVPTPSSGRVPPLSLPPFQPPAVVLPDQTSIPPSPALSHLQIPAMPPPPLPLFNPSPTSASLPPSSHTSSPAFADVEMGQEDETVIRARRVTPFAQDQEGPPPLAEMVSELS